MSTPVGFRYLYSAEYIDREMDTWLNVSHAFDKQKSGLFSLTAGTKSALRRGNRGVSRTRLQLQRHGR